MPTLSRKHIPKRRRAMMLAHGYSIDMMVEMINGGLASASVERVGADGRTMQVTLRADHRDLAARRPSWITGSERAYIHASHRAGVTAARLKQTALAALVLLTCIASGFGYYAWNQRNLAVEAFYQSKALVMEVSKGQLELSKTLELVTQKAADEERAKREAERERDRADAELKKAQTTQSQFLADLADQLRTSGDAGTAILLALEALPDGGAGIPRVYVPEAELQLEGGWRDLRELFLLKGHYRSVANAAFSPDGKRIVTASDDKTARIYNAETSEQIGQALGHTHGVSSAAFSPDGKLIVTASDDQTARVWDVEIGKQIGKPVRMHYGYLSSAAISPDGKRIVTASIDKTMRLWDLETGEQIVEQLRGHSVWSVAFSPDGKRIVIAAGDGTARLWDVETGKQIGEPLRGHLSDVSSAAFSPDGKRIVTASSDKTARLWDVETGKQIGGPLIHADRLTSAAFSPDGKRIVTASWDSTAQLWEIFASTQELVSHAKAAIPRCLTTGQRSAFFLPPSRRSGASNWRNGLTTPTNGNGGSARSGCRRQQTAPARRANNGKSLGGKPGGSRQQPVHSGIGDLAPRRVFGNAAERPCAFGSPSVLQNLFHPVETQAFDKSRVDRLHRNDERPDWHQALRSNDGWSAYHRSDTTNKDAPAGKHRTT